MFWLKKIRFFILLPCLLLSATHAVPSILQHDAYYDFKRVLHKRKVKATPYVILVQASSQTMFVFKHHRLIKQYTISTSKRGLGEKVGSKKTPRGLHRICAKIGDKAPVGAIFKGRSFTGRVFPASTPRHLHKRDHIVTRILQLEGLEPGLNQGKNSQGHNVDTKQRLVYIHATTMEWKLGDIAGIGCVHMSSADVIDLFGYIPNESLVYITE